MSAITIRVGILKRKQVRIYLDAESEKILDQMTSSIGRLSETAILTELVAAALKTCESHGNTLPLPLRFEIVGHTRPTRYHINETEPVEKTNRK